MQQLVHHHHAIQTGGTQMTTTSAVEAACERDAEGFLTLKGKVQFMDHFLKTHTHDFDESGFCMCGRLASLGSQVAQ
jgi:hypothetical protein